MITKSWPITYISVDETIDIVSDYVKGYYTKLSKRDKKNIKKFIKKNPTMTQLLCQAFYIAGHENS